MARRQHDSASASRHILRLNDWLRLFWRHSAGAADGYRLRGGNPGSAHSLIEGARSAGARFPRKWQRYQALPLMRVR